MGKYFVSGFYFLLLMTTVSCTYHSEDQLYPSDACDTLNVTYSGTVSPIIEHNCYDCHSMANVDVSQILLQGYPNILIKVNDGQLIMAIRHEGSVTPMPKDRPALAECDILKIEKWVAEGAPEN